MTEAAYLFGSFQLVPAQRLLLDGGRPVQLGSRALDILNVLVEAAGKMVPNDEIMAHAWPTTTVEESSLRVHIGALRKALGEGRGGNRFIANVPGRGYTFVAPMTRGQNLPQVSASEPAPSAGNLPTPLASIIGRDETIAALGAQLARRRLVTIVGPGGIGKTTAAVAVADNAAASYPDGVWFAALAPLADPGLVASTIAAMFGLSSSGGDPMVALTALLRDKQALIVLDNCEHVVDAAAAVTETILNAAQRVSILATSREPLRAEGEWLNRLRPLALPPTRSDVTASEALEHSAVQLFQERVLATGGDFALSDADAPVVCEICRKLDGLPLALELAAVQAEFFGIRGLAQGLNDRFAFLVTGRRTALPRQQTLRATIDWSYDLLPASEQIVLRRLGVFRGDFTMEAACDIAGDAQLSRIEVVDIVANLAAKSLVATDIGGDVTYHRLLDTTRAYALEKLAESSEAGRLSRRHAEYYRDLFAPAEAESQTRPQAEWLAIYGRHLDNVRAGLDWAFSPDGDAGIGIALTAETVPLWFQLSLLNECRERCDRALRKLQTDRIPDARLKMRLQIGLGNSLLHTRFPSEQAQSVLTEALQSAEAVADLHAQLRVLLDLASVMGFRGEYASAAAASERASAIAQQIGDTTGAVLADRRMGMILLRLGRLAEAQRCFERVIHSPIYRQDGGHSGERAMARAMLARALWLRGFSERALQEAQASLGEVGGPDRQLTMCRVLLYGMGRIAPMTGDFAAAETAISSIIESATSAAAPFWTTAGQFLRGKLLVERHQFAEGLAVLREAFDTCNQTGWRLSYPEFMGSFALALAGLGRLDAAHDAVCTAIDAAGEGKDDQQWYVPELLRIKGEVLLRQSSDQAVPEAEACLDQAAEMAREQGALFWELRIALSLARMRMTQGLAVEARQIVAPVYDRFTEGFAAPDLRAAKALLDELPR